METRKGHRPHSADITCQHGAHKKTRAEQHRTDAAKLSVTKAKVVYYSLTGKFISIIFNLKCHHCFAVTVLDTKITQ